MGDMKWFFQSQIARSTGVRLNLAMCVIGADQIFPPGYQQISFNGYPEGV